MPPNRWEHKQTPRSRKIPSRQQTRGSGRTDNNRPKPTRGLPDKGVFKVEVVRVKNEKNEQLINRLVVSGATILNYESPCEHGVGGLAWSERNTLVQEGQASASGGTCWSGVVPATLINLRSRPSSEASSLQTHVSLQHVRRKKEWRTSQC